MSLSKTESYSRTHLNASTESQISESIYRIRRTYSIQEDRKCSQYDRKLLTVRLSINTNQQTKMATMAAVLAFFKTAFEI